MKKYKTVTKNGVTWPTVPMTERFSRHRKDAMLCSDLLNAQSSVQYVIFKKKI